MPGTRCAVSTCNNSLQQAKKLGKNISFHRFPKDKDVSKMWIENCQRSGNWNPRSCHVCSEHFTTDDFERDLQAELLSLPPKKILKPNAVPSLKLTTEKCGTSSEGSEAKIHEIHFVDVASIESESEVKNEKESSNYLKRQIENLKRENSQGEIRELHFVDVASIVHNESQVKNEKETSNNLERQIENLKRENSQGEIRELHFVDVASIHNESQVKNENIFSVSGAAFEETSNNLEKQIEILKRENASLNYQLQEKDKTISENRSNIKHLQNQYEKVKSELLKENVYRCNMEESLKHFLSKSQRDLLFKRKKKVVWSSEDMLNAFAIRHFSKRCYVYLREQKKYPLPGISSLQRWASKLKQRQIPPQASIFQNCTYLMKIASNKYPSIPNDVAKADLLQRCLIRIKYLNNKKLITELERKSTRKIKKITSINT